MSKYPNLISDFLTFVKINSRSDEESTTIPSSPRETAFLKQLMSKLTDLGLSDVEQDAQSAYVLRRFLRIVTKLLKLLALFHILIRLTLTRKMSIHKLLTIMTVNQLLSSETGTMCWIRRSSQT